MHYLLGESFFSLLSANMYGFLIGGGILICIVAAYFMLKYRGYYPDIVLDVAIFCIPAALIGARLYYILFDIIGGGGSWNFFKIIGYSNGQIEIRGLAIYGGLIGASLAAILVRFLNKKKPLKKQMTYIQMLDAFFVLIILGQAIGRWGNFFNQEAYGREVTNPSMQFFPLAVYIDDVGAYHQATFFYEFFFNTIGFFILLWFFLGKKKSFDGFIFSCYCIWYGTVRAIVEGMRLDSLMLGPIRVSQLLSILLICFGAINIAYHVYKAKKEGKKVFILVDKSELNLGYLGYEKSIEYIKSLDANKNIT